MTQTRTIPIDAYIVGLKSKHNYFIDEEDKAEVEEIMWVFLVDRNVATYCCEMTPSYWLTYLYGYVVAKDGTDEERVHQLDDKYVNHFHGETPDHYRHCHALNGLLDSVGHSDRASNVYHYGETGVSFDDSSYDEQMEGLREHYQGNWTV